MQYDLFHQLVHTDDEFYVMADYTGQWPQYYVYHHATGQLCGTTNAHYYMGPCRIIMNDFKRLRQ